MKLAFMVMSPQRSLRHALQCLMQQQREGKVGVEPILAQYQLKIDILQGRMQM